MEGKEFNPIEETGAIFKEARKAGSLKDSFLAHAADYGVEEIEQLFPTAKLNKAEPTFLNHDIRWVAKVLGKTHKLPFSRVKLMFADLTEESIRAKGYLKGKFKKEDVFGLLKRTTEPCTIYKKGKIDRDDVIDITDFQVVSWIKKEMRIKLEEEIALAILLGDGRLITDEDKIPENCIRPVVNTEDLFTIKHEVPVAGNKVENFIDECVRARKNYKGSGNPDLYTTEDLLSDMLLLKDTTGRRIYATEAELKSAMRINEIVTVPPLEGFVRKADDDKVHNVMGIIANMSDYAVGTDKGGAVALFDDFDIDYNQQKYLIETRMSGALETPYSAIVMETVEDKPVPASLVAEVVEGE